MTIGSSDCIDEFNVYSGVHTAIDVHPTYGLMKDWDMSLVTSLNHLFYNKKTLNADVSNWDVSRVTQMIGGT